MITITTKGIQETVKSLGDIPQKAIKRVLLNMSQIAFDAVERGAGRHRGSTGNLLQSVYNRPLPSPRLGREIGHDPAELTVDWRGGTNRAMFVLFGTRPHDIRPRNKKVLRWPSGDRFTFARKVRHPGYRGDDYMTAAATQAISQFQRILDDALRDI